MLCAYRGCVLEVIKLDTEGSESIGSTLDLCKFVQIRLSIFKADPIQTNRVYLITKSLCLEYYQDPTPGLDIWPVIWCSNCLWQESLVHFHSLLCNRAIRTTRCQTFWPLSIKQARVWPCRELLNFTWADLMQSPQARLFPRSLATAGVSFLTRGPLAQQGTVFNGPVNWALAGWRRQTLSCFLHFALDYNV